MTTIEIKLPEDVLARLEEVAACTEALTRSYVL